MNRFKFNLQLFADEPPVENPEPESKPEPKYTDEDVNKILDKKFAEWQKKQEKKIEDAKAEEREAAKLAAMDEQQKKDYELEQARKELDELKREKTLSEMSKTARKLLSDKGISVSDDLLSMMVTTDAEATKTAIDNFAKLFNESVETAVKERLRGEPPRRGTGDAPMTEIEKRIKKYS